jgi:di/tricarboxylate transporter
VAILLGVIVALSFSLAPVELVAFTGAVLMVVTRVLTPRSAARALDWNVLFILAGSVGLGTIVVESGLADQLAEAIASLSAGSVVAMVVVMAVATTLLTNITTNAAAASILTPVSIAVADALSVDPVMLLALLGTCISFTFVNPFSHQSNLMVMGPGGYSNASFVRLGIPLVAVSLVAVIATTFLLVA